MMEYDIESLGHKDIVESVLLSLGSLTLGVSQLPCHHDTQAATGEAHVTRN